MPPRVAATIQLATRAAFTAMPKVRAAWAAVWDRADRTLRVVVPTVLLKVARARAMLMAVVVRVTVKVIDMMARVMVQAAVMAMVEAVRIMARVAVMVMARADRVTDAVARTMVRVTRAMAADEARGKVRDSTSSTATVMAAAMAWARV